MMTRRGVVQMNYGEYQTGSGLGEDPMIFTGLINTFLYGIWYMYGVGQLPSTEYRV